MTMAISKAVEEGAKAVVCASTGNTSASAAAFAARAGLTCAVLIPEGHIALGKLAQALIHGARVLQVRGNFDQALEHRARARRAGPGHRGQLGQPVPDRGPEVRRLRDRRRSWATLPTSTASRWATPATSPPTGRATSSTKEAGRSTRLPRMLGFQAAGAAPIVEGHPIEHPDTVATAIRIGNPASWYGATSAASESGGGIAAVTDDEILEAYRFLATEESVFCEPASAASVAGLLTDGLPDGVGPGGDGGLRADRARTEGPRHRHQPDLRADGGRRRPRRRARRAGPLTVAAPGPVRPAGRGVVAARSRRNPVCWVHLRFRNRPVRACGRDLLVRRRCDQPVHGVGGSRIRDPSRDSHLPTP